MNTHPQTTLPFDVCTIDLKGAQLVEASAGTGKTYSLALLYLRLLVETSISVRQILVLTFTNAAAAEMEYRIRAFLFAAHNYLKGGTEYLYEIVDRGDAIARILQRALQQSDFQTVELRVRDAIMLLDELQVMTIHAFCQQSLRDYAYEFGVLEDYSIVESEEQLVRKQLAAFWRREITRLPPEVFQLLLQRGFRVELLHQIVRLFHTGYRPRIGTQDTIVTELQSLIRREKTLLQRITTHVVQHPPYWKEFLQDLHAKNRNKGYLHEVLQQDMLELIPYALQQDLNNPSWLQSVIERGKQHAAESEWLPHWQEFASCREELYQSIERFANHLLVMLYEKYLPAIHAERERKQLLGFSDLIAFVHRKLVIQRDEELLAILRSKYKALIVDEFQDTDRWQYELLRAIFHSPQHRVFYIGDPKQNIYRWRGADLSTYKRARAEVDHVYTMSHNYRSSPRYLKALNRFYALQDNPFVDADIAYYPVQPGRDPAQFDQLCFNDSDGPAAPIVLCTPEQRFTLSDFAQGYVLRLLHSGSWRSSDGKVRPVQPGDIAVLVRTNDQAIQMKNALLQSGVPAVVRTEEYITRTVEALYLYRILKAFLHPQREVRAALMTELTPQFLSWDAVWDVVPHIELLSECRALWKERGVFSALQHFMHSYGVFDRLLSSGGADGESRYTRLIQLMEILHQLEYHHRWSDEKLVEWLAYAMKHPPAEALYEQRIESAENAVVVSTIHKAKGLEFPIVVLPAVRTPNKPYPTQWYTFTPHTTWSGEEQIPTVALKYRGDVYTAEEPLLQGDERRLLYVALTRAVHHCAVFVTAAQRPLFEEVLRQWPDTELLHTKALQPYTAPITTIKRQPLPFRGNTDPQWVVTSYSALDTEEGHTTRTSHWAQALADYDDFIFQQLPAGPHVGNFIHALLEEVDFQSDDLPPGLLRGLLHQYGLYGKIDPDYVELMLDHVRHAVLSTEEKAFSLRDVAMDHRLNELEFFFRFKRWPAKEIVQLIPEIRTEQYAHSGVIHGFVDMVLYHEGKYYIIDWKTNHLGNALEDYDGAALVRAMDAHNYRLQYYIYTMALVRYLRQRLPNFSYADHFGGVFYLFLRGMRRHRSTGVYYDRPSQSIIDQWEQLIEG